VWSTAPGAPQPPDADGLQAQVESEQPRMPLLTTFSGPATVRAYTVAHGRDGAPQQGLVILDTADGRAIARVNDAGLLIDAESRELVGADVTVSTDGKRNEARW
jgi:acetyl-CoA C-acetyltransferase